MKYYKTNSEQTEQLLLKIMNRTYPDKLISPSLLQELSTDEVTVLAASLDDNPSGNFRSLTGYAKLKTPVVAENEELHVETEYVHFWFDVYFVNKIINEMSYIEPFFPITKELRELDIDGAEDAQLLMKHTIWGENGRYQWIKTKNLTGDDLSRRLFVKKLKDISHKYQWGQEARKLFQQSLKEENTKETCHVLTR